jgi:hypothetical protein
MLTDLLQRGSLITRKSQVEIMEVFTDINGHWAVNATLPGKPLIKLVRAMNIYFHNLSLMR